MPPFLKLLLIRHGQSTGNVAGRMQGHGDDGLTPIGRTQVQQLAQHIQHIQPTTIYSSPLRRTRETAMILQPNAQPNAQIFYTPALAEFQNGIFQGLTWAEAQAQHPELCQQLETSRDWLPIPGAETPRDARDRVTQFWQDILTTHTNGETLLIVSHSWIMQHLISQMWSSDRSWRIPIHNTAVFEFWIDHERWRRQDDSRLNTDLWQIVRFNDITHLSRM
jgi:2,3-bisphosphoglycerate-dependent phosphoglycerate mutase